MSNVINKRLFSVREAAFYLGISRALLYQWIAKEKIPVIKINSRTLIDKIDLDQFIEELKK